MPDWDAWDAGPGRTFQSPSTLGLHWSVTGGADQRSGWREAGGRGPSGRVDRHQQPAMTRVPHRKEPCAHSTDACRACGRSGQCPAGARKAGPRPSTYKGDTHTLLEDDSRGSCSQETLCCQPCFTGTERCSHPPRAHSTYGLGGSAGFQGLVDINANSPPCRRGSKPRWMEVPGWLDGGTLWLSQVPPPALGPGSPRAVHSGNPTGLESCLSLALLPPGCVT